MLSLDVGVAMQKEEGEGGQLSAAMDKANARCFWRARRLLVGCV